MNKHNTQRPTSNVYCMKANRKSSKHKKMRTCILLVAAILFLSCLLIRNCALTANAGTSYKYYTSVQIKEGDSLWSIAKNYKTKEYHSVQSYIEEVKQINHLSSDTINEDQYLCIPYYANELK